jgi:hypothetical protein
MCSLECAADRTVLPAEEDSPGALNIRKALKGYLNGGKDPWSVSQTKTIKQCCRTATRSSTPKILLLA